MTSAGSGPSDPGRSRGSLGTLCLYQRTSADKVREQAQHTGMPADEISLAADTVVASPDPIAALTDRAGASRAT